MMRRLLALTVVLVAMAVIVVAVVFVARRHREIDIVAVLPHAEGLRVGGAFTLYGRKIGEIRRVGIDGRQMRTEIRVTATDVRLHQRDSLRLRSLGIMGEKAVEVVPGDLSAPRLADGDTIYITARPRAARWRQP